MKNVLAPAAVLVALLSSTASYAQEASAEAGGACDPRVAELQVASAEAMIEEATELARSDEFGYSRLGGGGAESVGKGKDMPNGPKGRGGGSFSNMTCLERLMDSAMDVLFEPPRLPDLLGAMEDFICDQAENIYESVTGPVNEAIANTADLGGFFPGVNLGRMGGKIKPGHSNSGWSDRSFVNVKVRNDTLGLKGIFGDYEGIAK